MLGEGEEVGVTFFGGVRIRGGSSNTPINDFRSPVFGMRGEKWVPGV
jgi:hypothetical protein